MSQGIVQTIIQDKKGFLWFGTWNGLNKFDGYTFKNYKTSYKDGYILNTNRISQIAETKYGDIWCQAYDGRVYMFDNQTEKFIDILGSVAKGLDQYIKDNQIDIITLTSYKRNIFARLFNPSIARKMIFHSDTPLLVINIIPSMTECLKE